MFGGWKWKCKNHDFFECAKPKSFYVSVFLQNQLQHYYYLGWLAGWLLAWAQQQQQSEIHFFHKNQNFDSFTSASKFEILRKLNRKKINKDTKNLCFVSSSASSLPSFSFLTKWFVFSILLVLLLFLLNQWSVIVD